MKSVAGSGCVGTRTVTGRAPQARSLEVCDIEALFPASAGALGTPRDGRKTAFEPGTCPDLNLSHPQTIPPQRPSVATTINLRDSPESA
jgi:hypothetical protein